MSRYRPITGRQQARKSFFKDDHGAEGEGDFNSGRISFSCHIKIAVVCVMKTSKLELPSELPSDRLFLYSEDTTPSLCKALMDSNISRDSLSDPLLEKQERNCGPGTHSGTGFWKRSSRFLPWFHLAMMLLYTCFFALYIYHSKDSKCNGYDLIYSPAIQHLLYERRILLTDLNNNSFTGEPRRELDNAWHELLKSANIKITEEELEKLGDQRSIALADGSGYVAELGVYHELHCIKRVRQYFHLNYYHPNFTPTELEREKVHIDHCLEYLREVAICRGDPSITTFGWRDGRPTAHVRSDHQCIKWERLSSWAESRSVDMFDSNLLQREQHVDSEIMG